MENNEFKKVYIKSCTCYYFNNITKLEDFDIDNILIDKKVKSFKSQHYYKMFLEKCSYQLAKK